MANNFKPLWGYCVALQSAYNAGDSCLPLDSGDAAAICDKLGTTGFSYMVVAVPGGYVDVKITCEGMNVKVLSMSESVSLPIGSTLFFENTVAVYNEIKACAEEVEQDDDDGGDGDTDPSDDPLSKALDGMCKFTVCDMEYTFLNGVLTEKNAVSSTVAAGTYKNATVIWDGFKVRSVHEGCAVTAPATCDTCLKSDGV